MIKADSSFKVDLAEFGSTSDGKMELTTKGGVTNWYPLQFHFHSPSEHTINGKNMDLELHIVHLTEDGGLGAVLGIMFDIEEGGDGENLFVNYMSGLSSEETITGSLPLKGWLQSLNTDDFWSYDGSLTTPPCIEGVAWTVLETVQPISASQLKMFRDVWGDNTAWSAANGDIGNNRVTQPLNGRDVYLSGDMMCEPEGEPIYKSKSFQVVAGGLAVLVLVIATKGN
jgi:carbonic anhydrase